jgi:hypothetical protein
MLSEILGAENIPTLLAAARMARTPVGASDPDEDDAPVRRRTKKAGARHK